MGGSMVEQEAPRSTSDPNGKHVDSASHFASEPQACGLIVSFHSFAWFSFHS